MSSTYRPTDSRVGFGPWAVGNLVGLLPAHLTATFVWTTWQAWERGELSLQVLPESLAWSLFGYYMPLLLLGPALAYLAVVWLAEPVLPRRSRRAVVVLLGPAVMSAVVIAWASLLSTEPGAVASALVDNVAWLIILPAVFGLFVRTRPERTEARGDLGTRT